MNRRLAITHAGGPLAEALLEQLHESGIAPDSLVLLDAEERLGQRIAYAGTHLSLEDQHDFDYEDLAGVLLLEEDAELADLLQHADCPVISHLALSGEAPLFVPERGDSLPQRGFVKLPAAELATALPALLALQRAFGLASVQLTSVLSAMHHGQAGVDDLASQTIALLNSRDIDRGIFPQPLAFNLVPLPGGSVDELRQLLGDSPLRLGHQQLLAPAFHGLAIAVSLELQQPATLQQAEEILRAADLCFSDETVSTRSHCQQGGDSWVGQLEQPQRDPQRLQFWLVADPVKNGWLQFYRSAAEFLLKSVL
jgi:aspartate-semialdehyde dehydrogenase